MRKKLIGTLLVFLLAGPVILARAEDRIRADSAIRTVSIVILVDRELLAGSAGEDIQAKIEAAEVNIRIRKIVADASRVYKKEFGIVFVIEAIRPWDFPVGRAEINADNAIHEVATIADTESADVTIGIIKKRMFKCNPVKKGEETVTGRGCDKGERKNGLAGYAFILGNAAIIVFDEDAGVFTHEMGHIFGAEHTSGDSIMNDGKIGPSFDASNRNIILRNRNRTFEKTPLP